MSYKFIPHSVRAFKWKSIFVKYLLAFFIIFLLVFSLLAGILVHNANSQLEFENTKAFRADAVKLQTMVEDIFIVIDNNYSTFVNSDYSAILCDKHSFDDINFVAAAKEYEKYFRYLIMDNRNVDSVYLYSTENDYVFTSSGAVCASNFYDDFENKFVFENYLADTTNCLFHYGEKDGYNFDYLTIIYNVNINQRNCGYIAYNISIENIIAMVNSELYLVNKNNEVLFSSTGNMTCLDENGITVEYVPINNGEISFCLKSDDNVVSTSPFSLIVIVLVIIIASLVLSYIIASLLYYNIEKICDMIQNPFSEAAKERMETNVNDINEFSYITTNMKNIILENADTQDKLRDKLIQLGNAQARALQVQVSPHFLFNTLNLINSIALAELKRETKITNVTERLSKMLYTVLDTSTLVYTLRQEIDYTNDYIDIQKYKYEDFDVIWNVDEKCYDMPIVKFTLQPIIENAIHYGISPLVDRKGIIYINGYINNDGMLIIEIHDNGDKVSDEKVKEINKRINRTEFIPEHSIGLWNTNKRLKFVFGKKSGIVFSSDEKGTTVKIKLTEEFTMDA